MNFPAGRDLLPVHGFVLAGGKSSRMGRDKALLPFRGRPMVAIGIEKLREFCAAVSVAGNREDLRVFAPVVTEQRVEQGPAAGIEAALAASVERWVLLVPVDVPLVPAALLRAWAEAVLGSEAAGVRVSFLRAGGVRQPAFCMLHRDCAGLWVELMESGVRKLGQFYEGLAARFGAGALWIADAEAFGGEGGFDVADVPRLFGNVNTPEDLAALESWGGGTGGADVAGGLRGAE